MVRKTNFLSISVLVSKLVTFMSKKRKVVYEFLHKCFKTTERHSLVVCGSLCGEKRVYVNIYPLIQVFSKKIVLTNPNFPHDLSLFKHG